MDDMAGKSGEMPPTSEGDVSLASPARHISAITHHSTTISDSSRAVAAAQTALIQMQQLAFDETVKSPLRASVVPPPLPVVSKTQQTLRPLPPSTSSFLTKFRADLERNHHAPSALKPTNTISECKMYDGKFIKRITTPTR
jgi:hypothetical protein